jgi:flagellar motor switch protein FliN/FliY
MSDENGVNQDDLAAQWGEALAEQAGDEQQPKTEEPKGPGPSGEPPAGFGDLRDEGGEGAGDIHMESILDIPVTLSMEIGRTRLTIRNLLQLNQGSVVELDRLAGEPMDVLINGTLIAHGEVVVVNEKFGVRLTDVMSPQERIKKLR